MKKIVLFIALLILAAGCTQPETSEKNTVAQLLESKNNGDLVVVEGEVSLLGELFCSCFELSSGGKTIVVWYDTMTDSQGNPLPGVSVEGIENGDTVVVTGEFKKMEIEPGQVYEPPKEPEIFAQKIELVKKGEKKEESIEMVVKKGDNIKVDYTGTLEDGSVFDSSEGREPLAFEAGAGQMIKGFDAAVIGMKVGEEKTITLKPEEAYGEEREDLFFDVPKANISETVPLEIGSPVALIANNRPVQGKIVAIDENTVKVNLNHELAGKTLIFKLKIVEIVE